MDTAATLALPQRSLPVQLGWTELDSPCRMPHCRVRRRQILRATDEGEGPNQPDAAAAALGGLQQHARERRPAPRVAARGLACASGTVACMRAVQFAELRAACPRNPHRRSVVLIHTAVLGVEQEPTRAVFEQAMERFVGTGKKEVAVLIIGEPRFLVGPSGWHPAEGPGAPA